MKRKFKVVSIILAVAIIALIFAIVYNYTKVDRIEVRAEPTPPPYGMWIRANLTEKPDVYLVVPKDVDKWTKTALQNPEKWVHVDNQLKCWVWLHKAFYVLWNEKYYHIELIFVD